MDFYTQYRGVHVSCNMCRDECMCINIGYYSVCFKCSVNIYSHLKKRIETLNIKNIKEQNLKKYEMFLEYGLDHKPFPQIEQPCIYLKTDGSSILVYTRDICSKCNKYNYVISGDPCGNDGLKSICQECSCKFFLSKPPTDINMYGKQNQDEYEYGVSAAKCQTKCLPTVSPINIMTGRMYYK